MISVGRADFGADDPSDSFATFAFGHPRRATIDLLSSRIPGKRPTAIIKPIAIGQREFAAPIVLWARETTTSFLPASLRFITLAVELPDLLHLGG